MHDQQRAAQRADLLAKIRVTDVVDEMPLECQRLAADRKRRFAFGLDARDQRVVVVLHVAWVVWRTDAGHRIDSRAVVRGGDHGRPTERVSDEQVDLAAGVVHELDSADRVGDLV
jgi:hypothetical protein